MFFLVVGLLVFCEGWFLYFQYPVLYVDVALHARVLRELQELRVYEFHAKFFGRLAGLLQVLGRQT